MNSLLKIISFLLFSHGLSAQTKTFNFTGAVQNYNIPAGTTAIRIEAFGAQGGDNNSGGTGGLGASVRSTFPVGGANPLQTGQTIFVFVGGEGDTDGLLGGTSVGGFNGGGNGSTGNDVNGSGGGGASDVRAGGMNLSDRIIIAGGGGGAGNSMNSNGGIGGDIIGGDGDSPNNPDEGTPGTGGTQIMGGTGGTGNPSPSRDGVDGSLGNGGNGGFTGSGGGGAGGGGGFYGGGGGGASNLDSGGSGGGGSSFSTGNNTLVVAGCTGCTGNGQITITVMSTVPTLSEWGLIILALLIISIGVVFSTQRELAIAGQANNFISKVQFNKTAFLKYFGISLLTIIVIGNIAILKFNYEIMPFDFVGSLISAGLLAFVFQALKKLE